MQKGEASPLTGPGVRPTGPVISLQWEHGPYPACPCPMRSRLPRGPADPGLPRVPPGGGGGGSGEEQPGRKGLPTEHGTQAHEAPAWTCATGTGSLGPVGTFMVTVTMDQWSSRELALTWPRAPVSKLTGSDTTVTKQRQAAGGWVGSLPWQWPSQPSRSPPKPVCGSSTPSPGSPVSEAFARRPVGREAGAGPDPSRAEQSGDWNPLLTGAEPDSEGLGRERAAAA